MQHRIPFCLLLAALALPAHTLYAQSLADVSRKEEARRKAVKTPAKVYTNKDLKSAPPATGTTTETDVTDASSAATATDPGETAKPAAGEAKPEGEAAAPAGPIVGGKDQAYWGGRAKDLQAQLDRDKTFAQALQSRINALTTDFENRSDPAQRAIVEQDRNKALADLERVNQAVQNDQKAISDFEEEARRAAVPPGWLR